MADGAFVQLCLHVPLVGYEHMDIYLLIQPHFYKCACKSVATDLNISAGEMQF